MKLCDIHQQLLNEGYQMASSTIYRIYHGEKADIAYEESLKNK
jgi:CRISPR/Cas system-associated protein endoribonuclease Cas2